MQVIYAGKAKFVSFLVLSTLFFSYSVLNAQEPAKALAMDEAFAASEEKAQDVVKGQTEKAVEPVFQKLPRESYRGEVEELITEVPKEETMPVNIDSFVRYMPQRGVGAMPGTITLTVAESEANYQFKAFGRLPIELSLYTEYTGIKNTTGVKLPSHLTGLSVGVETTLPFFRFDKTYLRLKVLPSYFSDDWNFDSSAFRIPSQAYLIYQMNEKWTFVAGVAVYPDYEDVAWPIVGVIYKPNEKLSFNLVPERPNITYSFNDKLDLFVEGSISVSNEYEVSKDNLENIVLQYDESRIGTGAKYKFNKFIESSVSVGGVFNRKLQYRDSYGKVVIKDGFYSEFRVNVYL